MPAPETPYQPYAGQHKETNGAGDARPTAIQVVQDCNMMGKLHGKTVLITGGSAGLGVETARALYEAGATVFVTARDMRKLDKAIDDIVSNTQSAKPGPRPEAIEMHLDSLDGVRKGLAAFKAKANGQLNIPITNAGIMAVPLSHSVDGFELHMAVNHFAHFLPFQELKNLLLSSAKTSGSLSRVVCLSSAGHRRTGILFDDIDFTKNPSAYDPFLGYGQAKTANIYMANSITRHYSSQGIVACSVHPGVIQTELARNMTPDTIAAMGDFSQLEKIWKSPEQGAATTVWAAVSPHFESKNGGRYLGDVGEAAPAGETEELGGPGYAKHAYDEAAEEKLWKISCEAVGVADED